MVPVAPRRESAVTRLLREGRAAVERGWCQRTYRSEKGEVCALGALGFKNGMLATESQVLAQRALRVGIFSSEPYIHHWNDRPERTKQDVLDAYDRAIVISEGWGDGSPR